MNNQNSLIRRAVYNDPQEMHGGSSQGGGSAGYVPAPPSDGYNTKYLRADGTWQVPPDNNTIYTLTQDPNDGHKFTLEGSNGYLVTITIPDNDTIATLSSLGIGNVKNYDQSKAISLISRSGTTFTYTCLDGTTGTFDQQDTDTWNALVGATASADGTAGYAPAPPSAGYDTKFLRADGTWAVPSGGGGSYTPTIDIDGTTYEIEHYVSNGVPYTKLTEVSS